MGFITKTLVIGIGAKTGVYLVIIGGRITVIGRKTVRLVGGVVLQHRREPQRCHTQLLEIVQMLTDTVQIATMTQRGLTAVFLIMAHPLHLGGMTGALGKTVGHQHIQHIGIGETHTLVTAHLTGLQLVVNRET